MIAKKTGSLSEPPLPHLTGDQQNRNRKKPMDGTLTPFVWKGLVLFTIILLTFTSFSSFHSLATTKSPVKRGMNMVAGAAAATADVSILAIISIALVQRSKQRKENTA